MSNRVRVTCTLAGRPTNLDRGTKVDSEKTGREVCGLENIQAEVKVQLGSISN